MRAYERLIRYTTFEAASDAHSETCPSTPEQLEFGRALVEEMKALGIADAGMDENGYVTGTIEPTIEHWTGTVIGFIAHMDIVRDVPYQKIKPRVISRYDGKDLLLNEELGITMSPVEFPTLLDYVGLGLVVTDGTTLLGADDRAGVAEILTMAEHLLSHPEIRHGRIRIGFTPDEEIGRGADRFDVAAFGADFAFTADGAAFGEVEYETFNAASCDVVILGKNIHPGAAKGKMKNAQRIGMEFHAMLPEDECPERTEGYEGFYHLTHSNGVVEQAELHYILRDHDAAKLEARKAMMRHCAERLNEKYGEGTVCCVIKDNYQNMAEKILPHAHLLEAAREAVRACGGTPVSVPVRGGTDGSRLSFMGLPCPNLGTGSHNHHGKMEYACIEKMDQCVDVLVKIAEKYGEFK